MSELTETELDLSFAGFTTSLFNKSSMPPFSFRLALEDMTPETFKDTMSAFLVTGANIKYGKLLHELSEKELGILRNYLLSIGYDVDYNLVVRTKKVLEYRENGTPFFKVLKFNEWQVTYKVANQALNEYNTHRTGGMII